jgi:hypothetical protein
MRIRYTHGSDEPKYVHVVVGVTGSVEGVPQRHGSDVVDVGVGSGVGVGAEVGVGAGDGLGVGDGAGVATGVGEGAATGVGVGRPWSAR